MHTSQHPNSHNPYLTSSLSLRRIHYLVRTVTGFFAPLKNDVKSCPDRQLLAHNTQPPTSNTLHPLPILPDQIPRKLYSLYLVYGIIAFPLYGDRSRVLGPLQHSQDLLVVQVPLLAVGEEVVGFGVGVVGVADQLAYFVVLQVWRSIGPVAEIQAGADPLRVRSIDNL